MAVPYTFGSATTSIPLSQLDSNFATTITLGNTAIQLGNTVTTLNNMTLGNVTISSGTSNIQTNVANATGVLLEANGGTGTTTGYYGFKNRIINGAMVIDQRNAGASVSTGASPTTYTLDRWLAYANAASKYTVQQSSTAPAGFASSLKVTSSSAYSVPAGEIYGIAQYIEGYNIADLGFGSASAKAITISFWVQSSLTGTFGGSLINSAYNRSYPFTYTISSANTWEQKTITIAGDTSGTWLTTNGVGFRVWFGLGVGSTFSGTAGSWASAEYESATGATSVVGTNGATFYITGVQLEKGSTATSFDYRPYGTELALCQRYYYLICKGTALSLIGSASYFSATRSDGVLFISASMRGIPTFSLTTGTNYYRVYLAGSSYNAPSITLNGYNANYSGVYFYNNTDLSGLSNGAGWWESQNANSLIALSAEL